MKIVITLRALVTIFVTFMMTFRALEFIPEIVLTVWAFMAAYLAFMMALWTIAFGFNVIHFFHYSLNFFLNTICALDKNIHTI